MNINIANNLKRLRKQMEITQDDLASFIGVSFQAVSKWERGDGYPDIAMLPVIASFFRVTIDELLGMEDIRSEVKLEEIKKKHYELSSTGKIDEDIALLIEAVKIFPNDYWLLAELACFLDGYGDTEEERYKNRKEAIRISERIMKFCTDNEIRSNVQSNMCFTLWRNGQKERAVELAKNLPSIYKTRELTLNGFLSGTEKLEACQTTIQKLCWALWNEIKQLATTDSYTNYEKIELYKKSISIYELIYDKGDYLFSNVRMQQTYELMAKLYLEMDDTNEAIECIEKSAYHAITFSTLPKQHKYESLLVNALEYNIQETSTSSEKNMAWFLKNNLESGAIYETILMDKRMKGIILELDKYSN